MDDKKDIYRAHVTRSVAEMYQRMYDLLDFISEDEEFDMEEATDEQLEIIENCMAIEEEWVLDPEERKQCSLLNWSGE